MISRSTLLFVLGLLLVSHAPFRVHGEAAIPLPEHPRPDFQRNHWLNLNGPWQFQSDPQNVGFEQRWFEGKSELKNTILVPFPWGSPLSQINDTNSVGWYARTIRAPEDWRGNRVFLVIGACDWETQAFLDGRSLGTHRGGYLPFEFELTPYLQPGNQHRLVLRVDDAPRAFKLEGKQGYGNARGIWQTVYLEERPANFLRQVQFKPDIDRAKVSIVASWNNSALEGSSVKVHFADGSAADFEQKVPVGATQMEFGVSIPNAHLWSLDDPYLYEVNVTLQDGGKNDTVSSYFGMRKVGILPLPGSGFPYISLNDKPVYLQITLDQSYHPQGFYTFPSDAFMRDEILRSRRIGLNANRLHVKAEVPRKLYWADRLGLLLMADVPNSWGQPDSSMQQEIEQTFRGLISRDFNHPSIFAWVPFNETWGLFSGEDKNRKYLPETQDWVGSVYRLGKQLDPTRLVEDNSPCNYDHVETDINSWHAYLPGYEWRKHLDQVTHDGYTGSKWNFIGGRAQNGQPLLNSECGNVWGYDGSTGDCDWSWDYHIMMNEFRRHPKICGWLYTEHHDVINEWNGYYRFDRSEKFPGFEAFATGMTLRDLHSPYYISTGSDICRDVKPGQTVSVPLWASFMTSDSSKKQLKLRAWLSGWDTLGRWQFFSQEVRPIAATPWLSKELEPLSVTMPDISGLAALTLVLEDEAGAILHRNFTTFLVAKGNAPREEELDLDGAHARVLRFAPNQFTSAHWTLKQWNVLDGLKVNGAGSGFFEYRLPWPEGLEVSQVESASLIFEASAKQLFGKDKAGATKQEGDFMLGLGTHDPSLNPNSYPMTDTLKFPSSVRVRVAGVSCGQFDLEDDPADHRGILSWHSQPKDRKLREAGSYGYLVQAPIPANAIQTAGNAKMLVVRLEVDSSLPGGLAIYGERFGRYPLDPTLVFKLK